MAVLFENALQRPAQDGIFVAPSGSNRVDGFPRRGNFASGRFGPFRGIGGYLLSGILDLGFVGRALKQVHWLATPGHSAFGRPPNGSPDRLSDYLITGTRTEESQLANVRLFRRFQALEHMAEEDQQTIIRLIDAFVAQQRMAAVLAPVD